MRTLRTLVALALAAAAPSQLCAPVPPPTGQPALMPFVPACLGVVPPPVVWAAGNPGFALSRAPTPPIVPPGLPTLLVLGLPTPPLPLPMPILFLPAGLPGFLNETVAVVVPSGPSGPGPGVPVPLPIPPTGGPIGVLNVQTLVFLPPGILAVTGATAVTI